MPKDPDPISANHTGFISILVNKTNSIARAAIACDANDWLGNESLVDKFLMTRIETDGDDCFVFPFAALRAILGDQATDKEFTFMINLYPSDSSLPPQSTASDNHPQTDYIMSSNRVALRLDNIIPADREIWMNHEVRHWVETATRAGGPMPWARVAGAAEVLFKDESDRLDFSTRVLSFCNDRGLVIPNQGVQHHSENRNADKKALLALKALRAALIRNVEENPPTNYINTDVREYLIDSVINNTCTLAHGPTGLGKSFLATESFLNCVRIVCSPDLRMSTLLATITVKNEAIETIPGPLSRAYTNGGLLFVDEVNLAPNNELAQLLRMATSESYTPAGESVELVRHPHFRLLAAMNVAKGRDANKRGTLSTAVASMFNVIQFPGFTDNQLCQAACMNLPESREDDYNKVVACHNALVGAGHVTTIRDMISVGDAVTNKWSLDEALAVFYLGRFDENTEIRKAPAFQGLVVNHDDNRPVPGVFSDATARVCRRACRVLSAGRHVMLTSSKTSTFIAETVARIHSGADFEVVRGSAEIKLEDLFGRYVFTGKSSDFRPGPLTICMNEGKVLVIANIDHIPANIIEGINDLFELGAKSYMRDDKSFAIDPAFRVISTARARDNTLDTSDALANRFTRLAVPAQEVTGQVLAAIMEKAWVDWGDAETNPVAVTVAKRATISTLATSIAAMPDVSDETKKGIARDTGHRLAVCGADETPEASFDVACRIWSGELLTPPENPGDAAQEPEPGVAGRLNHTLKEAAKTCAGVVISGGDQSVCATLCNVVPGTSVTTMDHLFGSPTRIKDEVSYEDGMLTRMLAASCDLAIDNVDRVPEAFLDKVQRIALMPPGSIVPIPDRPDGKVEDRVVRKKGFTFLALTTSDNPVPGLSKLPTIKLPGLQRVDVEGLVKIIGLTHNLMEEVKSTVTDCIVAILGDNTLQARRFITIEVVKHIAAMAGSYCRNPHTMVYEKAAAYCVYAGLVGFFNSDQHESISNIINGCVPSANCYTCRKRGVNLLPAGNEGAYKLHLGNQSETIISVHIPNYALDAAHVTNVVELKDPNWLDAAFHLMLNDVMVDGHRPHVHLVGPTCYKESLVALLDASHETVVATGATESESLIGSLTVEQADKVRDRATVENLSGMYSKYLLSRLGTNPEDVCDCTATVFVPGTVLRVALEGGTIVVKHFGELSCGDVLSNGAVDVQNRLTRLLAPSRRVFIGSDRGAALDLKGLVKVHDMFRVVVTSSPEQFEALRLPVKRDFPVVVHVQPFTPGNMLTLLRGEINIDDSKVETVLRILKGAGIAVKQQHLQTFIAAVSSLDDEKTSYGVAALYCLVKQKAAQRALEGLDNVDYIPPKLKTMYCGEWTVTPVVMQCGATLKCAISGVSFTPSSQRPAPVNQEPVPTALPLVMTHSMARMASATIFSLACRLPLVLESPPGQGKTDLITQIAGLDGLSESVRLYRVNFTSRMVTGDVFGRTRLVNNAIELEETDLVKTIRQASGNKQLTIILFDELNIAHTSIASALQTLFLPPKDRMIKLPTGEVINDLEDLVPIVAVNPRSRLRNPLPDSMLDRSIVVSVDKHTEQELRNIMEECYRQIPDLSESTDDIMDAHLARMAEGKGDVTYREIVKVRELYEGGLTDRDAAMRLVYPNSVQIEDKDEAENTPIGIIAPDNIHGGMTIDGVSIKRNAAHRIIGNPLSDHTLSDAQNVAIKHIHCVTAVRRVPLLLGPSEAGMHTIVRRYGQLLDQPVAIMPLTADSDECDFVGREVMLTVSDQAARLRTDLIARLHQLLPMISTMVDLGHEDAGRGLFSVLKAFAALDDPKSTCKAGTHLKTACRFFQTRNDEHADKLSDIRKILTECTTTLTLRQPAGVMTTEKASPLLQGMTKGWIVVIEINNDCQEHNAGLIERLNPLAEENRRWAVGDVIYRDNPGPGEKQIHPDFRLIFLHPVDPRRNQTMHPAMMSRVLMVPVPAVVTDDGTDAAQICALYLQKMANMPVVEAKEKGCRLALMHLRAVNAANNPELGIHMVDHAHFTLWTLMRALHHIADRTWAETENVYVSQVENAATFRGMLAAPYPDLADMVSRVHLEVTIEEELSSLTYAIDQATGQDRVDAAINMTRAVAAILQRCQTDKDEGNVRQTVAALARCYSPLARDPHDATTGQWVALLNACVLYDDLTIATKLSQFIASVDNNDQPPLDGLDVNRLVASLVRRYVGWLDSDIVGNNRRRTDKWLVAAALASERDIIGRILPGDHLYPLLIGIGLYPLLKFWAIITHLKDDAKVLLGPDRLPVRHANARATRTAVFLETQEGYNTSGTVYVDITAANLPNLEAFSDHPTIIVEPTAGDFSLPLLSSRDALIPPPCSDPCLTAMAVLVGVQDALTEPDDPLAHLIKLVNKTLLLSDKASELFADVCSVSTPVTYRPDPNERIADMVAAAQYIADLERLAPVWAKIAAVSGGREEPNPYEERLQVVRDKLNFDKEIVAMQRQLSAMDLVTATEKQVAAEISEAIKDKTKPVDPALLDTLQGMVDQRAAEHAPNDDRAAVAIDPKAGRVLDVLLRYNAVRTAFDAISGEEDPLALYHFLNCHLEEVYTRPQTTSSVFKFAELVSYINVTGDTGFEFFDNMINVVFCTKLKEFCPSLATFNLENLAASVPDDATRRMLLAMPGLVRLPSVDIKSAFKKMMGAAPWAKPLSASCFAVVDKRLTCDEAGSITWTGPKPTDDQIRDMSRVLVDMKTVSAALASLHTSLANGCGELAEQRATDEHFMVNSGRSASWRRKALTVDKIIRWDAVVYANLRQRQLALLRKPEELTDMTSVTNESLVAHMRAVTRYTVHEAVIAQRESQLDCPVPIDLLLDRLWDTSVDGTPADKDGTPTELLVASITRACEMIMDEHEALQQEPTNELLTLTRVNNIALNAIKKLYEVIGIAVKADLTDWGPDAVTAATSPVVRSCVWMAKYLNSQLDLACDEDFNIMQGIADAVKRQRYAEALRNFMNDPETVGAFEHVVIDCNGIKGVTKLADNDTFTREDAQEHFIVFECGTTSGWTMMRTVRGEIQPYCTVEANLGKENREERYYKVPAGTSLYVSRMNGEEPVKEPLAELWTKRLLEYKSEKPLEKTFSFSVNVYPFVTSEIQKVKEDSALRLKPRPLLQFPALDLTTPSSFPAFVTSPNGPICTHRSYKTKTFVHRTTSCPVVFTLCFSNRTRTAVRTRVTKKGVEDPHLALADPAPLNPGGWVDPGEYCKVDVRLKPASDIDTPTLCTTKFTIVCNDGDETQGMSVTVRAWLLPVALKLGSVANSPARCGFSPRLDGFPTIHIKSSRDNLLNHKSSAKVQILALPSHPALPSPSTWITEGVSVTPRAPAGVYSILPTTKPNAEPSIEILGVRIKVSFEWPGDLSEELKLLRDGTVGDTEEFTEEPASFKLNSDINNPDHHTAQLTERRNAMEANDSETSLHKLAVALVQAVLAAPQYKGCASESYSNFMTAVKQASDAVQVQAALRTNNSRETMVLLDWVHKSLAAASARTSTSHQDRRLINTHVAGRSEAAGESEVMHGGGDTAPVPETPVRHSPYQGGAAPGQRFESVRPSEAIAVENVPIRRVQPGDPPAFNEPVYMPASKPGQDAAANFQSVQFANQNQDHDSATQTDVQVATQCLSENICVAIDATVQAQHAFLTPADAAIVEHIPNAIRSADRLASASLTRLLAGDENVISRGRGVMFVLDVGLTTTHGDKRALLNQVYFSMSTAVHRVGMPYCTAIYADHQFVFVLKTFEDGHTAQRLSDIAHCLTVNKRMMSKTVEGLKASVAAFGEPSDVAIIHISDLLNEQALSEGNSGLAVWTRAWEGNGGWIHHIVLKSDFGPAAGNEEGQDTRRKFDERVNNIHGTAQIDKFSVDCIDELQKWLRNQTLTVYDGPAIPHPTGAEGVDTLVQQLDVRAFNTDRSTDRIFADRSQIAHQSINPVGFIELQQCALPTCVSAHVAKVSKAISGVVTQLMDAWSTGQYKPNRATRESYNSEGRGMMDIPRAIQSMMTGYRLYNDFYRVRDRNPVNDRDASIIIDVASLTSDAAILTISAVLNAFLDTNDHGRTDIVLCCSTSVCKIVDSTKDFDLDPAAVLQAVLAHMSVVTTRRSISSGLHAEVNRLMLCAFTKKDVIVLTDGMFDANETAAISTEINRATETQITVVAIGLGPNPVRLPVVFPVSAYGSSGPALARAFRSPPFTIYGEDMSDASKLCHSYTVDETDKFYHLADPEKAPRLVMEQPYRDLDRQMRDYARAAENQVQGADGSTGHGLPTMNLLVFFGYVYNAAEHTMGANASEDYVTVENFERYTGDALRVAGYETTNVMDWKEGAEKLKSGHFDAAMIFCSRGDGLTASFGESTNYISLFTAAAVEFRRLGGFLLYCCDNPPFTFEFIEFLRAIESNDIKRLADEERIEVSQAKASYRNNPNRKEPIFKDRVTVDVGDFMLPKTHLGGREGAADPINEVIVIPEGDTIANVHEDRHANFNVVAKNSAGEPMTLMYYSRRPGDKIVPFGVDSGATKFYQESDGENTALGRFVRAQLFYARSLKKMASRPRPSSFTMDMTEPPEFDRFVPSAAPIEGATHHIVLLECSKSMKKGGSTSRWTLATDGVKKLFTDVARSHSSLCLFNGKSANWVTSFWPLGRSRWIGKNRVAWRLLWTSPKGGASSFKLPIEAADKQIQRIQKHEPTKKIVVHFICDGADGGDDDADRDVTNSILERWKTTENVRFRLVLFDDGDMDSCDARDRTEQMCRLAGTTDVGRQVVERAHDGTVVDQQWPMMTQ